MSGEAVSTDHLDYLQRAIPDLGPLPATGSVTRAFPTGRRLWHVRGVGRIEKRPSPPERTAASEDGRRTRMPSEDALISLYGHRVPAVFLLSGDMGSVKVQIGTWTPAAPEARSEQVLEARQSILSAALRSLYTSVEIETSEAELPDLPLSGLALGIPTAKPPDPADGAAPLDRLVRAMSISQWACLILAEPVKERTTSELRRKVIEEMRRADNVARADQASRPLVEHYLDLLKSSLTALTSGVSTGMWRTAVYLLGDRESYYRLASLWSGIFSGDESLPEPVRVWDDPDAVRLAHGWAMPDTPGEAGPGFYQHPLKYQTLLTSRQLAAYVHLPQLESNGFSINTVPSFDAVPPSVGDGNALNVGTVVLRGQPTHARYAVRLQNLTRHTFIAGVTGAGKTNTIFRLLEQAAAAGVPFLVIEPAKAEYRSLLNAPGLADRLQIFTLGNELVSPFRLNPFEALPGIPIGVHLDLLRSAFAASFGMWTPLPQVLEQCLYRIYEDRGWDLTTSSNRRLDDQAEVARAFPTLSDLAAKVHEVTQQLGYEDRVTADMRAALLTRINGLRIGGKGRMLDVQHSLPMEVLLQHPTVLELEGMGDDDDKAFVMGLLLVRLLEYRRTAETGSGLQHLLVIEEAHRLLTNVGQRSREEEANPRGKAVETFSNLLAEIRAYGQGVIIADQVPVKLAPDVIKNTGLKIVHRVVAADDRAVLAGAMAMDERQALALSVLTLGEAAVFGEGDDAPVLVKVDGPPKDARSNDPPADAHIAAHVAGLDSLRVHLGLLRASSACTEACTSGGPICQVAGRLVEEPPFQRTFARLVLSTIEDVEALDRLWPELVSVVQAIRPPRIDEAELWRCLMIRAAHWLAHRRGAQAGWSYAQTEQFATRLKQILLNKLDQVRRDPERANFQRYAYKLHARPYDPFPACSRICRQGPPVCLYRYAAADLIATGTFRSAWHAAEAADERVQDGRRSNAWTVCTDACDELIEIGQDDWPEARLKRADAAVRRASLCFGQQILAGDVNKSLSRVRGILDQFLKEAGNE